MPMHKPPVLVEDQVRAVEPPWFVNLIWDDDENDWDVSSNLEDQTELTAALSHVLFQFAAGLRDFEPGE